MIGFKSFFVTSRDTLLAHDTHGTGRFNFTKSAQVLLVNLKLSSIVDATS